MNLLDVLNSELFTSAVAPAILGAAFGFLGSLVERHLIERRTRRRAAAHAIVADAERMIGFARDALRIYVSNLEQLERDKNLRLRSAETVHAPAVDLAIGAVDAIDEARVVRALFRARAIVEALNSNGCGSFHAASHAASRNCVNSLSA